MRFPILIDAYRQRGKDADRMLSVELPPDLSVVVQPTRFELAINLKAAKPVGVEVPPSSIARADEVFELDRLICCGTLFGPCAMSDLSPECAPKRTFANVSEFMSSRPRSDWFESDHDLIRLKDRLRGGQESDPRHGCGREFDVRTRRGSRADLGRSCGRRAASRAAGQTTLTPGTYREQGGLRSRVSVARCQLARPAMISSACAPPIGRSTGNFRKSASPATALSSSPR